MSSPINIFWFRRDLRLNDNCGLFHALSSGRKVLPVFIFDRNILDELVDKNDLRVNFIYQAVLSIHSRLSNFGSSLHVYHGRPQEIFETILKDNKVETIFINHDYEPYAVKRDEEVKNLATAFGAAFKSYKDQVIFEKLEVTRQDGDPFSVFTPYSRRWKQLLTAKDLHQYPSEDLSNNFISSETEAIMPIESIGFTKSNSTLIPEINYDVIGQYHTSRNIPSLSGTTRAGIHLRFGTISIRSLVAFSLEKNEVFLGELIWREFFMQMLWHHPRLQHDCFKSKYDNIIYKNDEKDFLKWKQGQTGYPIVDAGMRELNATGTMHNRVRMITASFLVKHLLIDWRWGEAYFAEKLLDYELASNLGNWQWVAGCGCDAAPYFRIFSPYAQTKKFDSQFEYIKKWVPEFEDISYPSPIVDHAYARERCLAAYRKGLS